MREGDFKTILDMSRDPAIKRLLISARRETVKGIARQILGLCSSEEARKTFEMRRWAMDLAEKIHTGIENENRKLTLGVKYEG